MLAAGVESMLDVGEESMLAAGGESVLAAGGESILAVGGGLMFKTVDEKLVLAVDVVAAVVTAKVTRTRIRNV